jgi:hypothetical protein
MNPELERLISADEEARVRLEAARSAARARIEAYRSELEGAREARRRLLEEALEQDIRAIREAGQRDYTDRERRRAAYREERRKQAERLLPQAIAAYLAVVRDGPAGRKP